MNFIIQKFSQVKIVLFLLVLFMSSHFAFAQNSNVITINSSSALFPTSVTLFTWSQNEVNFTGSRLTKSGNSLFLNNGNAAVAYVQNTTQLGGTIRQVEVTLDEDSQARSLRLYVGNSSSNLPTYSDVVIANGVEQKAVWNFDSEIDNDFFKLENNIKSGIVKIKSIKITIDNLSTVWNGFVWSNGDPTSLTKAIVRGAYDYGFLDDEQHFIAKALIIENDITFPSGVSINLINEIDNSLGFDVVFEDKSYFIQQNPEAVNKGIVAYRAKSKKMMRNDMTHWSSPVLGQRLRGFSPGTLYNRFWYYNENTSDYLQLFNVNDDNDPTEFEIGNGVAIRVKYDIPVTYNEETMGEFIGVLNNGKIVVPVIKSESGYGFNLVGNPYPSPINIQKFFDQNPNVEQIFIWTPYFKLGTANYGNNYITITRDGYTSPYSLDSFDIENIAAGQGFFVEMNENTDLIFTNEMRVDASTTLKRASLHKDRFWLNLTTNNSNINQVMIGYFEGATTGFDPNRDATSVESGQAKLYTLLNNRPFSIQARPYPLNQNDVVALGLLTDKTGVYAISLNQVEGVFTTDQDVILRDKYLNIEHNLSLEVYEFESEIGEFNDRFEVIYVNRNLNVTNVDKSSKDIVVYTDGVNGVVKAQRGVINQLYVFDSLGRLINSRNGLNVTEYKLHLAKGLYYIKVVLDHDSEVNAKLIL